MTVRAGLRALRVRDTAFETWLRTEVAETYDAMRSDKSRAIPASQVFDALRARHASKLKDKR